MFKIEVEVILKILIEKPKNMNSLYFLINYILIKLLNYTLDTNQAITF
jgi:hypothetical protein